VNALSAAYDDEFDPSAQSAVPQVVEGLLADPPIEFVAGSRDLAHLLLGRSPVDRDKFGIEEALHGLIGEEWLLRLRQYEFAIEADSGIL
jgi:hypothetical protein